MYVYLLHDGKVPIKFYFILSVGSCNEFIRRSGSIEMLLLNGITEPNVFKFIQ